MLIINLFFLTQTGIESAKNLPGTDRFQIIYNSDKIGAREIVKLIASMGYSCYPQKYDTPTNDSYLLQRKEIQHWRRSFIFSFCFGLPSTILMIYNMIAMSNKQNNDCCLLPGWSKINFMQFLLATPIQFYGARHFYKQVDFSIKKSSFFKFNILFRLINRLNLKRQTWIY